MGMKIDDLQLLRLLPGFMRNDEASAALSKAVSRLLSGPGSHIKSIRVWDKIDDLTDAECDDLAWELDIDWYDSGATLTQKRETIKDAQKIKRKRGTKWAVERVISIYFGAGYLMEWFDVPGANPYDFYVMTTNTDVVSDDYDRFMSAVRAAKNTRSHIAGVFYYWPQGPDPGVDHPGVVYSLDTKLHRYNHKKSGTLPRIAVIGILLKPTIETEPDTALHKYEYTVAGTIDCGTYPYTDTIGAGIRASAAATPEAAYSLYGFIKCGTRRCGQIA